MARYIVQQKWLLLGKRNVCHPTKRLIQEGPSPQHNLVDKANEQQTPGLEGKEMLQILSLPSFLITHTHILQTPITHKCTCSHPHTNIHTSTTGPHNRSLTPAHTQTHECVDTIRKNTIWSQTPTHTHSPIHHTHTNTQSIFSFLSTSAWLLVTDFFPLRFDSFIACLDSSLVTCSYRYTSFLVDLLAPVSGAKFMSLRLTIRASNGWKKRKGKESCSPPLCTLQIKIQAWDTELFSFIITLEWCPFSKWIWPLGCLATTQVPISVGREERINWPPQQNTSCMVIVQCVSVVEIQSQSPTNKSSLF